VKWEYDEYDGYDERPYETFARGGVGVVDEGAWQARFREQWLELSGCWLGTRYANWPSMLARTATLSIVLAFAGIYGCGQADDVDVIFWEGSKSEILPTGIDAILVEAVSDVVMERDAGQVAQTYRWEGNTLKVETEALVVPPEALIRDRAQLTGRAHLRIEPEGNGALPSAETDFVFELQYGTKDSGWHKLLPPDGYRWRSLSSLRIDATGPYIVVVGEVCRYEERYDDAEPRRHCEYVRRWDRASAVGVRMIPYPAWPPARDTESATVAYYAERINLDDVSSGERSY
jgi:hypothetical protein